MSLNHFLAISNESSDSFRQLLDRAAFWKRSVKSGRIERVFGATDSRTSPRVLAMVFQKPSNRTRVSFEMAMHHLGGKALYLSPQEIGLGKRESTSDVARVLGRYVDMIMARVFSHEDVEGLAKYAEIPVINGLSNLEHPCQALGDFQTIFEQGGNDSSIVCFVGDGNNVCHSLMLGAALLGMDFRWIGPAGYEPSAEITRSSVAMGGRVSFFHDMSAIADSDFIYTDVWTSMGDEAEAEVRQAAFRPYRIDGNALSVASKAKVLHCLPAHRGDEITDEVMDGVRAVVFDQAENRLYAQMAVLERAMSNRKN